MLRSRQAGGQPIRSDGPEGHILTKKGTPTMGGFLILLALSISTLLWADLTNGYVWAVMAVTLSYGLIGFVDDNMKVRRRTSAGMPATLKLILQVSIAIAAGLWIMRMLPDGLGSTLAVPFFKNVF